MECWSIVFSPITPILHHSIPDLPEYFEEKKIPFTNEKRKIR